MNLPEIYEERAGLPSISADDPAFFRQDDDEITFSHLLAMLRRRLSVLVLTTAICVMLGLLWTISSPKIYEASANVVMIANQPDPVPGNTDTPASSTLRDEDIQTVIQLLASNEMADQVYDELDLDNDAAFRAEILQPRTTFDNIRASLGMPREVVEAGAVGPDFRERAVGYLMRALTVERQGTSYTLRISVQDSSAERSAQIANAFARIFTTDDARQRAARNTAMAQVLGDRLADLRSRANENFAAVQAYRVRNDLLSASATGLSEQEISTYNQQIASARAEAAQTQQTLASARAQLAGGGAGNVGQGTASGVISALRAQRAQLTAQEADLARRYLDRHPELVTVREQIVLVDQQIDSEINREIRSLEASAQAAQQRLNSLLASRAGTRSQLRGDNTALVQLTDLEREAASSQALYESYLQRYNEVVAGSGTEQPSARMISIAAAPVLPSSPNFPLMLALSLAVGAALGTLLAIALELAYRGLTTLDDVEAKLGLVGLGFIPRHDSIKPSSATPLATIQDYPDGPFAESLRNVLVSIGRASNGRCEVIAVTSAIPGEGKTTVTSCLGRTLAMANQSVVVVDCDIVRSSLSRLFGHDQGEPGLHEALLSPDGEIAHYLDADSSLQILPITKPFRKGLRLTEGDRLSHVVARLRDHFDFVILDCPPILPIAETRNIVALADHVVLVVGWRKTIDKIVKSAIKQLPRPVLARTGVALNLVDMKKQVKFGGSDAASYYNHYKAYYG